METTTPPKPVYRALHIENDEYLLKGFHSCVADQLGIIAPGPELVITQARTIDEATAAIENEDPPFDVLIVDLMLPRNDADHKKEQALQAERRILVRQLFEKGQAGRGEWTVEIEGLRLRIRAIDDELKKLIVDDGGLEIIDNLVRKNDGKQLGRPVVFWTARGLPTIKECCLALVHPAFVQIFEKPVREVEVLKAAVDLARKRPEKRP